MIQQHNHHIMAKGSPSISKIHTKEKLSIKDSSFDIPVHRNFTPNQDILNEDDPSLLFNHQSEMNNSDNSLLNSAKNNLPFHLLHHIHPADNNPKSRKHEQLQPNSPEKGKIYKNHNDPFIYSRDTPIHWIYP